MRIPSVQETNCIHHVLIYYGNEHKNDQLTVGLITQLVKHCTDIVAVIVLNPVQA